MSKNVWMSVSILLHLCFRAIFLECVSRNCSVIDSILAFNFGINIDLPDICFRSSIYSKDKRSNRHFLPI